MKRIFFLLPIALSAAPVGNPAAPQLITEGFISANNNFCLSSRVGYEGDFVSDARMKQTENGSGDIDNYTQDTNSGTVTLSILDRADVYGVFGSSRTYADWRFNQPDGATNRIELETSYRFVWAAGGRFILYEWGNAILGLGGRYSQSSAPISWITFNGAPESISEASLDWHQWQVNLLFSYKIDLFIPYLGMNYLSEHTKAGPFPVPVSGRGSDFLHLKNRSSTGLVIGASLTTGKYFMLNIEGRLINEEAFSISGDIKF